MLFRLSCSFHYTRNENASDGRIFDLHVIRIIDRALNQKMESSEVDADQIRTESESVSNSKNLKDTNKTIKDKLMKVNNPLKPPVSPTSLLAQNIALLPTGVAKVNKQTNLTTEMKPPNPGSSTASATGNPRNKTALAPGHSLMDWIRLGASGVDLTGVGGIPKSVTPLELSRHNKPNDAWLAIRGIVYNVTRYMDFHPGGKAELMKGVGKDATKLFDDVHAWVNYQSILQKCVVGRLNRLAGECPTTSAKTVTSSTATPATSSSTGLLSRCTKQNSAGETASVGAPQPKMDWIQTSNTITLFYYALRDHPAVGYQLTQITDSKFQIKFCFEKDVINHEVELSGAVDWPPKWKRNFESMKIEFTYTKKQAGIWKTYGTFATLGEPKVKQRTYREFQVVSNTSLCKLVNLLVLRANKYLEIVPIGRHVEAKLNIMGTEVSRMYTPVPPYLHPDHIAPDYNSDCICLMVKIYSDGALTPTMTSLKAGQNLTLSNSLGTFVVEDFQDYTIIHMLAAGTGLTAMLPNVQWALGKRNMSRINILNFNRNEDNVFYAKELEKVYSGDTRLTVSHILSHPSDSWTGRRGETSSDLLQELIGPTSVQACVFLCGPLLFMQKTKEILLTCGWKLPQLHQFDD